MLLLFPTLPLLFLCVNALSYSSQVKFHRRKLNKAIHQGSFVRLHAAADQNTDTSAPLRQPIMYPVTLHYQGVSCQVEVASSESILVAMERHHNFIQSALDLPFSDLPFDCRRGNCLTCAAQLTTTSKFSTTSDIHNEIGKKSITKTGDVHSQAQWNPDISTIFNCNLATDTGLSPTLAKQVQKAGFVLTCSTRVTGPNVHLKLMEQDALWSFIYQKRLDSDEMQAVARRAMARLLRKTAEKNVQQWTKETEETLRNSNSLEN